MLRPCYIFDLITGKYVYRIKSQVCKLNLITVSVLYESVVIINSGVIIVNPGYRGRKDCSSYQNQWLHSGLCIYIYIYVDIYLYS